MFLLFVLFRLFVVDYFLECWLCWLFIIICWSCFVMLFVLWVYLGRGCLICAFCAFAWLVCGDVVLVVCLIICLFFCCMVLLISLLVWIEWYWWRLVLLMFGGLICFRLVIWYGGLCGLLLVCWIFDNGIVWLFYCGFGVVRLLACVLIACGC